MHGGGGDNRNHRRDGARRFDQEMAVAVFAGQGDRPVAIKRGGESGGGDDRAIQIADLVAVIIGDRHQIVAIQIGQVADVLGILVINPAIRADKNLSTVFQHAVIGGAEIQHAGIDCRGARGHRLHGDRSGHHRGDGSCGRGGGRFAIGLRGQWKRCGDKQEAETEAWGGWTRRKRGALLGFDSGLILVFLGIVEHRFFSDSSP